MTSSEVEVLRWQAPGIKARRCAGKPAYSRGALRNRDDAQLHTNSAIGRFTDRAMLSTIALLASSRRRGNTGQLVDRIAQELGIEVVDLSSQRILAYDYSHLNRNDDFEALMGHVLAHQQIIFATPIYWYAVSPPMKAFLDRLSDLLELPDLLSEGRRLRGKNAYIVCTSIDDEPSAIFVNAFLETFNYLGMHFGGAAHVNCRDGYLPALHDPQAVTFATHIRSARYPATAKAPWQ